jgi:anti-sigma B factor antagonist
MGPRNLELIRNLGLHRLLTIDTSESGSAAEACDTPLVAAARGELENARLVLEAHENLVSADETNRGKFQDVLVFMKNRVEQG